MNSTTKLRNNFPTGLASTEKKVYFYEKGKIIPLQSTSIWQLNHGVVQFFQSNPDGQETILGWGQTNHFFGSWLSGVENIQVKALSDVYLQQYYLTETEQNSDLVQRMLAQLVIRFRQTEELLTIVSLTKIEDRLIALLKLLAKYLGEKIDSSVRIRIRFTHQNLADSIATTRVTVTRLLGELQKQELITFDRKRHIILVNS